MIEKCFITKDGRFYRPNRAGYTNNVWEAGLYDADEAQAEVAIEPYHMRALPALGLIDHEIRKLEIAIEELKRMREET